jgi:hypothetical protein
MPAHESVDLPAIGGMLAIPLPRCKLDESPAKSAAMWTLPLLAITLFAKTVSGGFITARSYPAGLIPVSVAVGDFNGDGIADLAVVDNGTIANQPCKVSVLLGQGDGSFAAPQQYAVGTSAQVLALGDFNGDGLLDIAVSNTADGTVSVLLGNGDGTFEGAKNSSVGGRPTGLAVGDFNGDGLADLAVAIPLGFGNGTVTILLGRGDGSFQPAQNIGVGVQPWSVAVADFNGDGIVDLAVTNSEGGSLSILLGNGDGTFQAAVTYPLGVLPRSLVVADFNGDGHPDIAVANAGSTFSPGTLSVLLGNGDGTFQTAHDYPTFPPAGDSTGYFDTLAVGDFDGDGHLDLAMTGQYGVVIWLGRGDGSFQFQTGPRYNVGTGSVAVADFNQDGHADLAVTNAEANAVRILVGNGDGTFQAPPSYPTDFGDASAVAVGDFNGDGIPDFAMGTMVGQGGEVLPWLGNPDGTYRNFGTFLAQAPVLRIATADFNGDGKQDILICTYNPPGLHSPRTSGIQVWRGNGRASFAPAFAYDSDLGIYAAEIGDFNGDGIPDIVIANHGWPYEPGNTVSVFLGKDGGTFQVGPNYRVLSAPNDVVVADFSGDGKLDLAVGAQEGLSVLLGNGDGTFQAAQNYPMGAFGSLVTADFNSDGVLDLAVWQAGTPGTVQIMLGQGDGTFQVGPTSTAGSAGPYIPAGLATGDFNGDGITDLAVTDSDASSVSVLLGKGDGTFAEPQNFAVGTPVNSLAVADFNGDGNLDLAVACGSTVTILLNDGHWPP